jgi:hypothetical protein
MTCRRYPPSDHNPTLPFRRKHALDEEVGRRLCNDVWYLCPVNQMKLVCTRGKTYVVYGRNPIVLVGSHPQLRHDITLGALVHDTRVGHIVCVDILEEKHD